MKDSLVHAHPNAIETYKIVKGEMEFFIKDKWATAKNEISLLFRQGEAWFPKPNILPSKVSSRAGALDMYVV